MDELRQAMYAVAPHLAALDQLFPADAAALSELGRGEGKTAAVGNLPRRSRIST